MSSGTGRPEDRPTAPDDVEVDEDAGALPPDADSLAGRFADPTVRNYLFTGLAALAMIFVVMFQQGSDLGGLMLVILGAAGMVLRWSGSPLFFLLVLFWFLIFPFGFPDPYENPFEIVEGRFRIVDLILVGSVTIYLMCHYRLYGLTAQAIPFEQRFPKKDEKPPRRPPSLIRPGEIAGMLYLAAGLVIAGQLVWIFATHTVVEVSGGVSFGFAAPRPTNERPGRGFSPETTRFILLAGFFFFGTLLTRLVFGYWRLRLLSPAEGRMILQDASWDETRRERARVENWRAWGRMKAQERAAGQRPGEGEKQ
jgi:hypothetical protein